MERENCRIRERSSLILSALFIASLFASIAMVRGDLSDLEAAPGQSGGGLITLGTQEIETSLDVLLDSTNMALDPNHTPSTLPGTLNVKANGPWKISVSTDTGGYATEYDIANNKYVPGGEALKNPLFINAEVPNGAGQLRAARVDLSKGDGILASSSDACNSLEIPIVLTQEVTWDDRSLESSHAYRFILTFTISSAGE